MGRRAIAVLGLVLACCATVPLTSAAAKKRKPPPDPVLTTLSKIARRGGTEASQAAAWRRLYNEGKSAARRLRGSAQGDMQGVLGNLASLARGRQLEGSAYPAFLVLQRNIEWFWQDRRGPVGFGTRTTFPGSQLTYEFYPGSGWQLQPLANFGRLNGLLKLRHPKTGQLEGLADEMLATGVTRRGFLAFEYYFPWSGGGPGWVSGMATATGMQAFSTLWKRDGQSRYLDAAKAMLPVFKIGPPSGVRLRRPEGLFFLQYSQAPRLLVGNAYAQSILGLDTYATNTGDSSAAALVSQAVTAARRIMPQYDTGAWSLYYRTPSGPGTESDLGYHRLFESFLDEMCARWQAPFCTLAANYHRYETEPVALTKLQARQDRRHHRLLVRFTISKRSGITLRLVRGNRNLLGWVTPLGRGQHFINWPLPGRGKYVIVLGARSLNGIPSEISLPLTVRR